MNEKEGEKLGYSQAHIEARVLLYSIRWSNCGKGCVVVIMAVVVAGSSGRVVFPGGQFSFFFALFWFIDASLAFSHISYVFPHIKERKEGRRNRGEGRAHR